MAEGLPVTSVYSISTDARGFLWLGTPKGLVRYDGARFHVFSAQSSADFTIPTTDASNAFVDSKGRLWLGSWGRGLALYDENLQLLNEFKQSSVQDGALGSNRIQVIFEDSKGRIWVGTHGGGLAKYVESKQRFVSYQFDHTDEASISHNRIWSIAEDQQGRIWAGTTNGLNLLKDEIKGRFQRFFHASDNPLSLNNSLIRKLFVDHQNRLWVGTEAGFGEFNMDLFTFTPYEPQNGVIGSGITAIKADHNNRLWVGAQKGLYLFDPDAKQFTPLGSDTNYPLLGQDDLRDIAFDKNGILWVATRYGGLAKIQFKPGVFSGQTHYIDKSNQHQPIVQVLSLYKDSSNIIWMGTQKALLRLSNEHILPHEFIAPDASDLRGIRAINEDPEGNLWLGSENGLHLLSPSRDTLTTRNDLVADFNSKGVNQILFDSEGATWLGLKLEGILRLHNGDIEHFYHDANDLSSLSYNAISQIYEDKQQRIWIATNGGGLNQYIPLKQRFIRYENHENDVKSLSSNSTFSLFQDAKNVLWVATESGLNQLDETSSTFTRYGTSHGMKNSTIRAVTEDTSGNIWFTSDNGIGELKVNERYFVNYTLDDQLHGLMFSNNAALKLQDNRFIFGGMDGYTIMDLGSVNQLKTPPSTIITQLWVDRQQRKQDYMLNMPNVALHHATRDIQIDFATLDFINPQNNRYQYRLLGFDDSWSPTTFDAFSRYTGLSYGDYVFEVRGANSAGVWSNETARLPISIIPPYWAALWFQILVVTLLALLLFTWVKLRTKSLKQQKYALEKEVQLRSDDLIKTQKQLIEAEKHAALSRLVAGVAHEINTPVGISVTAASTLKDISESLTLNIQEGVIKKKDLTQKMEQITVGVDMVLRNLHRAGELVRSFKEVAVDQMSDEKRRFNVKEYIDEIIMSVKPQLRDKNIAMHLTCPDDLVLHSYPGAIAQIMTNLIINALIHGFEQYNKGKIDIVVATKDKQFSIELSDNGEGIAANHLNKIFDPFYTTKRNNGGNGLGLHIIKNLVTVRLHGTITCQSTPGEGTCFSMVFPLKPD